MRFILIYTEFPLAHFAEKPADDLSSIASSFAGRAFCPVTRSRLMVKCIDSDRDEAGDSGTEFDHLLTEHLALGRQYGAVQARCSRLVSAQRRRIEVLEAEAIRLRAAVVIRDTELAFARESQAQWASSVPDLPGRVALSRCVESLKARLQSLMRERLRWEWWRAAPSPSPVAEAPTPVESDDLVALEASLFAADLVICQTGCLSHGAYWRVQDHCRRTGKPCVVVARPEALRIVRIHGESQPLPSGSPDVPVAHREASSP